MSGAAKRTAVHVLELVELIEANYGREHAWACRVLAWASLEHLASDDDFDRVFNLLSDPSATVRDEGFAAVWSAGWARAFIDAAAATIG